MRSTRARRCLWLHAGLLCEHACVQARCLVSGNDPDRVRQQVTIEAPPFVEVSHLLTSPPRPRR